MKPLKSIADKLNNPEFLLLMVVFFMLWSVGFVDLVSRVDTSVFTSLAGEDLFIVFLLIAHLGLFIVWLAALIVPNSDRRLKQQLASIQSKAWLATFLMLLIIAVIVNLLVWHLWLRVPGFSTVILITLLLIGLLLLFLRADPSQPRSGWRKPFVALLVLGIGLELIAQGIAFVGMLPGDVHQDGGYVKYGRIYQDAEGFSNRTANSDGWYANEFVLADEGARIAVIGDTFIQALQVEPDEHLAQGLQAKLSVQNADEVSAEVLPLGHAGFGPSLYLNVEVLKLAFDRYEPDEIVVYVHLGNDLRNLSNPVEPDLPFIFSEEGKAVVHPDQFDTWHDAGHYMLNPHEPLHPFRIFASQAMLPSLWRASIRSLVSTSGEPTVTEQNALDIPGLRGVVWRRGVTRGTHTQVRELGLVSTDGYSNFLFDTTGSETADEAHAFTQDFIRNAYNLAQENGIAMRLVTIPIFPQRFYTEFGTGQWEPNLESYDLFLPERRLQTFAESEGIPVLAMGQYLQDKNLATADIQALFFSDGTGHLTPTGHDIFADATYGCFYASQPLTTESGCINSPQEVEAR